MKPRKSPQQNRRLDLFRPDLAKVIDHGHGLVKLANVVDWDRLDDLFGENYCPATRTRLRVSLQYLKYTDNLSDDDGVAGWVENPYWQYLSGMQFFGHEPPKACG